jgi:hypothetical protein
MSIDLGTYNKSIIAECVDPFTRYNRFLGNSLIHYSLKEVIRNTYTP